MKRCLTALVAGSLAATAWAHDGEDHSGGSVSSVISPEVEKALEDAPTSLPWEVGGDFDLVDHTGQARTQVDPDGKYQLLFFGYANCPGICSAALPMMAHATEELAESGIETQALVVTIDPKLDTLDTMGPSLAKISDRLLGLTGSPEALGVAYDAYNVTFEKLFDDPQYGPIYSHGSFIYLLDPEGNVLTQLPPILPPEQVAQIVQKYANAGS